MDGYGVGLIVLEETKKDLAVKGELLKNSDNGTLCIKLTDGSVVPVKGQAFYDLIKHKNQSNVIGTEMPTVLNSDVATNFYDMNPNPSEEAWLNTKAGHLTVWDLELDPDTGEVLDKKLSYVRPIVTINDVITVPEIDANGKVTHLRSLSDILGGYTGLVAYKAADGKMTEDIAGHGYTATETINTLNAHLTQINKYISALNNKVTSKDGSIIIDESNGLKVNGTEALNLTSQSTYLTAYGAKLFKDIVDQLRADHTALYDYVGRFPTLTPKGGVTPSTMVQYVDRRDSDLNDALSAAVNAINAAMSASGASNAATFATKAELQKAINDLIGPDVPQTLDTLKEIVASIGTQTDVYNVLNNAIGTKLDKYNTSKGAFALDLSAPPAGYTAGANQISADRFFYYDDVKGNKVISGFDFKTGRLRTGKYRITDGLNMLDGIPATGILEVFSKDDTNFTSIWTPDGYSEGEGFTWDNYLSEVKVRPIGEKLVYVATEKTTPTDANVISGLFIKMSAGIIDVEVDALADMAYSYNSRTKSDIIGMEDVKFKLDKDSIMAKTQTVTNRTFAVIAGGGIDNGNIIGTTIPNDAGGDFAYLVPALLVRPVQINSIWYYHLIFTAFSSLSATGTYVEAARKAGISFATHNMKVKIKSKDFDVSSTPYEIPCKAHQDLGNITARCMTVGATYTKNIFKPLGAFPANGSLAVIIANLTSAQLNSTEYMYRYMPSGAAVKEQYKERVVKTPLATFDVEYDATKPASGAATVFNLIPMVQIRKAMGLQAFLRKFYDNATYTLGLGIDPLPTPNYDNDLTLPMPTDDLTLLGNEVLKLLRYFNSFATITADATGSMNNLSNCTIEFIKDWGSQMILDCSSKLVNGENMEQFLATISIGRNNKFNTFRSPIKFRVHIGDMDTFASILAGGITSAVSAYFPIAQIEMCDTRNTFYSTLYVDVKTPTVFGYSELEYSVVADDKHMIGTATTFVGGQTAKL